MDDSMIVVIESDVSFLFLLVCSAWFVPTDLMEPTIGGGIVIKHDMLESGLLDA
jgi:hypothetical protein